MTQHDPRCDQHHTPRQRCNRHMTPAAARIARLATEGESDVRQAIATIEPPEPTMLVPPARDGAAAEVERAEAASPARPAAADPARAAALVGLGVAVVAVVITKRRRQPSQMALSANTRDCAHEWGS